MEDKESRAELRLTAVEFIIVVLLGSAMGIIYGVIIIPFFLVVGSVIFAALVSELHEVYGSKVWLPTLLVYGSAMFSLVSFVMRA